MENKLAQEMEQLVKNNFSGDVASKFLERIGEGGLTRDENPQTHFCAYFAAYDRKSKQVFIGHHKKSGLWLFNGGHVDEGETLRETVAREIGEEWGLDGQDFAINPPTFISITEIENPAKQTCTRHYDFWCFIPVDKDTFSPADANLLEEFHEYGWKTIEDARKLVTDKSSFSAIDFVEHNLFL